MKLSLFRLCFALALSVGAALPVGAYADSTEGGHDHPLVGRFEGSKIVRYAQKDFDEYPLIVKKITHYGGIEKNSDAVKTIEGKVTKLTYRTNRKHSTLAVFRAYRNALTNNGFEILFHCKDAACGGRDFNHASPGYRFYHGPFAENYDDQRYLAARLERASGNVYVSIDTVRASGTGGVNHDAVYTQTDVLEVKPLTGKVVVVKATEMAKRIAASGRVALHDIYFDTDKAALKPSSKPALDEVAKLLQNHPKLKLLVVGHTDNQGGFDYNITLSKRRAAAVVKTLIADYGISSDRLKPWGDGYTAPAASNRTEAGRAKNRRVELVAQ